MVTTYDFRTMANSTFFQFNTFNRLNDTVVDNMNMLKKNYQYLYENNSTVLKALIIDDEYQPREVLLQKLKMHCTDIEVVGYAENIEQGYQLCNELHPNIVFLDITMPNGTGFDFLKKFDRIPFEVIFCSAHAEYAIDAFKMSAVGYLLKPINTEDLIAAVNQIKSNFYLKDTFLKYQNFLNFYQGNKAKSPNIVIPTSDKYEVVKVADILYLEGCDKYTYVFVADGRKILSSNNIGKFKNIFAEYQFYVTHKSFIVNLDAVSTITYDDEIILSNGSHVPLARRRKLEFLDLVANR